MNFPKVIQLLQKEFAERNIDFALVGGLAIHALGISRTTRDVDGMAFLSNAADIDAIMKKLGYETLQRTEDIGNYLSKDWEMGRIDILFAHRPYAISMLQRAQEKSLFGGKIKVLMPEDIVGLKVQAIANNPERTHKDMADIETLLRLYGKTLDWKLVQEYFHAFDLEKEFHDLSQRFKDA
jgi:predicted nucleotidyltransferase